MRQTSHFRTLTACLMVAGFTFGTPNMQAATAAIEPSAPIELLLANRATATIDPSRYLVSEKYDGVRAFWDGRTLRFRSGREIAAPQWFLQRLPETPLDGELWLGRGRFDALSGIVRSASADEAAWQQVRYVVFELPGFAGTFVERAARIEHIVATAGWPQLRAATQRLVTDRAALDRLFRQTIAAGGEGLMLHLATAPYKTGRSDDLIKLKPQLDDEAVVVSHRPGKGKYAGMLGAVQLRANDGRRFWVGSGFSDAQRRDPPAVGSVVTYRYRELTSGGLPRFASFARVREID